MLGMFGLSLLTAALGTIIPVVRLAKKKPVEILRSVELKIFKQNLKTG